MIEASINGVSGNLILDTGAPYLVLNKTYFRKGISETDQVSTGITGKGGDVLKTTVKKFQLQELYYENVEADITNLAQIENSKGVKVLGLMGTNLFTEFEMLIDSRRDVLILYKLDKKGERINKDDLLKQADINIPFTLLNNIIYIDGSIKEKSMRFCFDSGAEVNVLSTKVSKTVLNEFIVQRRSMLVGSGGQRAEVINGIIKAAEIGGHSFATMQTYLTPLGELQRIYDNYFDGILGYPLMFNGTVGINFKKKEFSMYLYGN
jgi:5S rRNA maturation endonuclease (ribonuclease M5)